MFPPYFHHSGHWSVAFVTLTKDTLSLSDIVVEGEATGHCKTSQIHLVITQPPAGVSMHQLHTSAPWLCLATWSQDLGPPTSLFHHLTGGASDSTTAVRMPQYLLLEDIDIPL